ncbi:hypothetical protein QN397_17530, partial [Variovorax sp. RTB1]|nr:hypothetical protein [Variovorax sp. RTB1]
MLFDKFSARSLQLSNRMVMAPMTRNRATPAHTPNALMATYYGQRATAGLIISEGTSPSPNGLGYPRIPGLYDAAQVKAWKATTAAVHERGVVARDCVLGHLRGRHRHGGRGAREL